MSTPDREHRAKESANDANRTCPSPEAISSWIEGSADDSLARTIADHVRSCEECTLEAILARRFVEDESRRGAAPGDMEFVLRRSEGTIAHITGRPPVRRRTIWVAVLATTLGVAAAIAVFFRGLPFESKPIGFPERGHDGSSTRGDGLELIGPIGDLTGRPDRFEWQPLAGAAEYRVRIRDVAKRVLHEANCPSHALSLSTSMELDTETRYLWNVQALDSAGNVISTSAEASFVIRIAESPHR